ncbi:hypothetical protein CHS0354_038440 [Potamilus streckersoni]|uniref:Uncharacterized protein n=1 Tax=Potamilus streckersoni TaxID=2493646 RepID=A0AAE0S671_9BIVA|nr:hypothetical protein CHS0354_038440 [Potamilus streckersoni]
MTEVSCTAGLETSSNHMELIEWYRVVLECTKFSLVESIINIMLAYLKDLRFDHS